MDIYTFINSKAVANHCRRIKHQFNTIESAFLVQKSHRHTISEKHIAFVQITATMPDMPFKQKHACDIEFDSFHEFLRQYMACENKALQSFKQADDCLYTYDLFSDNKWLEWGDLFNDWESCLDYAINDYKEYDVKNFRINKRKINSDGSTEHYGNVTTQTVLFNKNKEPLSVDLPWSATEQEKEIFNEVFDSIWFVIPTPFTKGDIVYDPYSDKHPNTPFVLTYMDPWDTPEKLERKKTWADISEMTATGIFQCNTPMDPLLDCWDNYSYYFDLEFYNKKLVGRHKALESISLFIKGDIDLDILLNAYMEIHKEENWKYSKANMDSFNTEDIEHYRQHWGYIEQSLVNAGVIEEQSKE